MIKTLETLLNEFYDSSSISGYTGYQIFRISEDIELTISKNAFANIFYVSASYDDIEMTTFEIWVEDVTKENFFDLIMNGLKSDILEFEQKVINTSKAINSLDKSFELELLKTMRFK